MDRKDTDTKTNMTHKPHKSVGLGDNYLHCIPERIQNRKVIKFVANCNEKSQSWLVWHKSW